MNIDTKCQLGKLLEEFCKGVNDVQKKCIICYEDCPFLKYEKCPILVIADKLHSEIIKEIMKE